MQIRVLTQKADISTYLERLGGFLETENNDECRNMIADEMSFVEQLSYNVAVKKRFFIAFDFTPKGFDKAYTFAVTLLRALLISILSAPGGV